MQSKGVASRKRNVSNQTSKTKSVAVGERAQKAVDRARRSMAKFKAGGGGDKHWRLSPTAMEDLKYIKENCIPPRTEQKIIAHLLRQERKRLEIERV